MNIVLDANICLDLLDTSRPTSKRSVEWYLANKDNEDYSFFFSGDFITTFYYILTEKRKHDSKATLLAIDALSDEIAPHYITHIDFKNAKEAFFSNIFKDFEDLLILSSASRIDAKLFMTNDKKLLQLSKFQDIEIVAP
jgi:predicted nucleic acid-binding protein